MKVTRVKILAVAAGIVHLLLFGLIVGDQWHESLKEGDAERLKLVVHWAPFGLIDYPVFRVFALASGLFGTRLQYLFSPSHVRLVAVMDGLFCFAGSLWWASVTGASVWMTGKVSNRFHREGLTQISNV